MWTLTLDPELFDGPESAYRYCATKRVIGELVRALDKRGHLHTKRYFCAVEYQKNGMPHFHLLVDASFVPFDVVCECWNRNRPKDAGPVQGNRPAFGSVRFTAPKFASTDHAANYATKYVIKTPEEGWPDWVLGFVGNLPRYSVSKGFWGETAEPTTPADDVEPIEEWERLNSDPILLAWIRAGRVELAPEVLQAETVREAHEYLKAVDPDWFDAQFPHVTDDDKPPKAETIGERIARCRQRSIVFEVTETMLPDGEVIEERRFVQYVDLPFSDVLDLLQVEETKETRHGFRLRDGENKLLNGEELAE